MMIEGFLIVTLWKCNNPRVDKNQQTPTLIADFQISVRTVAFTHFNSLCQFKLIFQTEATAPTSSPSSHVRVGNERVQLGPARSVCSSFSPRPAASRLWGKASPTNFGEVTAACGAAADADILSHFKINSLLRSLPPTLHWPDV